MHSAFQFTKVATEKKATRNNALFLFLPGQYCAWNSWSDRLGIIGNISPDYGHTGHRFIFKEKQI